MKAILLRFLRDSKRRKMWGTAPRAMERRGSVSRTSSKVPAYRRPSPRAAATDVVDVVDVCLCYHRRNRLLLPFPLSELGTWFPPFSYSCPAASFAPASMLCVPRCFARTPCGAYCCAAAQDLRAGETYAIDYNMIGFSVMSRHAARLNLVVLCNGTDFLWEGPQTPSQRNSARRAS